MFAEWEYFGSRILAERHGGGQILVVRAILEKNGVAISKIDSIDNDGVAYNYYELVALMSLELATQIEKILKEGVKVGKSP